MAKIAHPPHMENFLSNIQEVRRLEDIHGEVTEPGPGRKHDVAILHKSAIVLLVACWEAFVEDLAGTALGFAIDNAKDYKKFPAEVLNRVASKYQGPRAWDLAGDGWTRALRDNMKEVLAKTTGTLNTPKTEQVNELFEKVIGLKNISSYWSWPGRPAKQSEAQLDALVTLRGSIAHRVQSARTVRKKDVLDANDFLHRLAVRSHNEASTYLERMVGAAPWALYRFHGTA